MTCTDKIFGGADLDAGPTWRALETEIGPREEVMAVTSVADTPQKTAR
ncbi:hypothetical protein [Streptomyces sp. BRA346]